MSWWPNQNAIAGKKLRCYQSEKTSDRKLSKNCLLYYCTRNLLIFIWLFVGVLLFVVVGRFPISSSSFSVFFSLNAFVSLFLFLFYFAIWPSKWVQTTRRTCNFSRIYTTEFFGRIGMNGTHKCVRAIVHTVWHMPLEWILFQVWENVRTS